MNPPLGQSRSALQQSAFPTPSTASGAELAFFPLSEMPNGQVFWVHELRAPQREGFGPGLLLRLAELGFASGEEVVILRRGPGGREPLAVQINNTVFALRQIEADCIVVTTQAHT